MKTQFPSMIELLDHYSEDAANQIYCLFQQSYKIEAQLAGLEDFPPLRRSALHISAAGRIFLGLRVGRDLAAVIEYSLSAAHLIIDSLVVHPKCFRRRFASKLLQSLLDTVDWQTAEVETAAANHPAIALYKKYGFSESKYWTTNDGIDKVQLSCSNPQHTQVDRTSAR